ncbi:VOC family protein [Streptomyces sp. PR69]|uniref:VOC family protein n=1 Tax=Streptomyces sp. PR69 TaxID=2984950 RepID=UPI0022651ED6|nr:VOC family protein [Streptomyces sp. PR69]
MAAFAEGMPCWVDASLPDVEAGKRFYGELFGWTFTEGDAPGARSAVALSDGRRVAALTAKRDGRMPTEWGVSFAASDAAALARKIQSAGGQVITSPGPLGTAAVTALCADPGGAVFGLWQELERPGFEKQGLPGSFCWAEVYTRDKEHVDPFYESVFGFQGTDLEADGDEGGVDYRLWSPAGKEPGEETAIGGRSVITEAFPAEMPGHFLVYFTVADCDEAARTVVRLGGRVQAEPFDTAYGRIAVVVDDQGAAFAVLAEPEAAEPEDPGDERGASGEPEPGTGEPEAA